MKNLGVTLDVPGREAALEVPKAVYSDRALEIAAHVFAKRAEVYVGETKAAWELTLKARRKDLSEAQLGALAGDFLVELLNQEYRFLVSELNKDIAALQGTQALFAARGGENPPVAPKEDAAFKKAAAALMAEATKELARTVPKRIAPPGTPPVPPAEGD